MEVGESVADVVENGEIQRPIVVFLVVSQIGKQFFEDFGGELWDLEVFWQEIRDLLPFLLRQESDPRREQAFVVQTLCDGDSVRDGASCFGTATFDCVPYRVPEV